MKFLAIYDAAATRPGRELLDDDLAAWLQGRARANAEPGPSRRAPGSRLVDGIARRLAFWRTALRIVRRPA